MLIPKSRGSKDEPKEDIENPELLLRRLMNFDAKLF